jgi:hypothetical protein
MTNLPDSACDSAPSDWRMNGPFCGPQPRRRSHWHQSVSFADAAFS